MTFLSLELRIFHLTLNYPLLLTENVIVTHNQSEIDQNQLLGVITKPFITFLSPELRILPLTLNYPVLLIQNVIVTRNPNEIKQNQ